MFILPEAVLGLIKPPKYPLFSNLFFLLRKIVAAGYFDSSGFVYFPVLPGVKFLSGDATERLFWDCFDQVWHKLRWGGAKGLFRGGGGGGSDHFSRKIGRPFHINCFSLYFTTFCSVAIGNKVTF